MTGSQFDNEPEFENKPLLTGYQNPSELSYPEFINIDDATAINYDPVMPVKQSTDYPEDSKQNNLVTAGGPPPTIDDVVIHEVKPTDTIERLCIQYNVNKDVIRKANDFTGEEIYMFKQLRIPFTRGKLYESMHVEDDEETK